MIELVYLDRCLKETLRLRPPIMTMMRMVKSPQVHNYVLCVVYNVVIRFYLLFVHVIRSKKMTTLGLIISCGNRVETRPTTLCSDTNK